MPIAALTIFRREVVKFAVARKMEANENKAFVRGLNLWLAVRLSDDRW
jgi:hypothetical protein